VWTIGKLCQNSETPEAIDTKFGTGDYVGDIALHFKIHIDHPGVGAWASG